MAGTYKYQNTEAEQAAMDAAIAQANAAPAGKALTTAQSSGITQSYYTSPTNAGNYESGRPVYAQSDAVKQAAQAVANQEAAKPGAYQSNYNDQIQGLIDKLLNRDAFRYDFAKDPMYQQYADRYQQQGQMAMKGAMGDAASLTGGYGNSYAQSVGQQTYQNYLQNLNSMIPELRNAAYQQYQNEGDTMRSNLGMLQTQEASDYGKYRDTVGDWRDELNYMYGKSSDMSNQEYQRYMNDSAAWQADRAYWYQKQYDEQQQRNWEAEFNARYADTGGGGGGGGGRSGSGKSKATATAISPNRNNSAIGSSPTSVAFVSQYRNRPTVETVAEKRAKYGK